MCVCVCVCVNVCIWHPAWEAGGWADGESASSSGKLAGFLGAIVPGDSSDSFLRFSLSVSEMIFLGQLQPFQKARLQSPPGPGGMSQGRFEGELLQDPPSPSPGPTPIRPPPGSAGNRPPASFSSPPSEQMVWQQIRRVHCCSLQSQFSQKLVRRCGFPRYTHLPWSPHTVLTLVASEPNTPFLSS